MSTDVNPSDEAESLSRIPLFKRLTPDELEQLAKEVDQVRYEAEETIFNEQDRGDALYVVEDGSVRIWVLDEDVKPVTLTELKPGEFFGDGTEAAIGCGVYADAITHRVDRVVILIEDEGSVVAVIVVEPDAQIIVDPRQVERELFHLADGIIPDGRRLLVMRDRCLALVDQRHDKRLLALGGQGVCAMR